MKGSASKTIALLMFAVAVAATSLHAQLGALFFRVEIASNNKPLLAQAWFQDTEGVLVIQGPPLATVIARAYDLEPFRVIGGPDWLNTSHLYDIKATPPPARFSEASEAEMLQAMLVDRFNLEFHLEQREFKPLALKQANAVEPAGRGVIAVDGLARQLSLALGQPVHNLTGLTRIRMATPGLFLPDPADVLHDFRQQSDLVLEPEPAIMLDVLVITGVEHPLLED